jgi:hypothetical protein
MEQHVNLRTVVSSAVDPGFDYWEGQTKDYKLGICCFSDKQTILISIFVLTPLSTILLISKR